MNAGRVVIVPWISASDSGLQCTLQGPAQRTRTIAAVHESFIQNPPFRFFGHRDRDVTLGQVTVELLYQQFKNLDQVASVRPGTESLRQTVQELRVEGLLDFLFHKFFTLSWTVSSLSIEKPSPLRFIR